MNPWESGKKDQGRDMSLAICCYSDVGWGEGVVAVWSDGRMSLPLCD